MQVRTMVKYFVSVSIRYMCWYLAPFVGVIASLYMPISSGGCHEDHSRGAVIESPELRW